jgi:hypothetical protein
MNYLDCLPNDLIYIIYEKKHRLEYPSVMRELKRKTGENNSKVRVGDGVKVYSNNPIVSANTLYVVIWKGKRFLDLYDYNKGNKIRVNYHNDLIRPSTIDYIIKEIFANNK